MNYLLTLFLLAFIRTTFAQICGDNEEYTTCGTACPETCENMNEPDRMCTMQCVVGCQCKSDYVRDDNGNCILKSDCTSNDNPECSDPNETYNPCGTACPVTCKNMKMAIMYNTKICTMQCIPGCFCNTPYVRDDTTGKCVLRKECSSKSKKEVCTDPNEVFNSCGTDCPITCKNYENPPQICDKRCRIGCFCAEPYVRDEDSGKCVLTKDCKTTKIANVN